MFTGLVQSVGILNQVGSDKVQITCTAPSSGVILSDLSLGDSVAVDGVCLTVVEILAQGFVAVVSPETRDRSTLAQRDGAIVNLEPSLRVGSKLGGHFVTGHVDGIGYLQEAVQASTAWEMTFTTPSAQVSRYIIPKGSIAVNGISLTVADCDPKGSWFTVAVIPHTYDSTTLHSLHPGSVVNLEGDILGKYVEKFMQWSPHDRSTRPDDFTEGFLAEHGYL